MEDRNFDDLARRFQRNVYGTLKGDIRLAVLERDFRHTIPEVYAQDCSWQILDIGAGQGLFSLGLSGANKRLVLCDISRNMLDLAQQDLNRFPEQQQKRVSLLHCPVQGLAARLRERNLPERYPLVICHALLEWLAEPEKLFDYLLQSLQPGGVVSLIFYNINGLAFKNLLRTNFNRFDFETFQATPGSLTPSHPQHPDKVQAQLEARGIELLCASGIRVFHDFILDPQERNRQPEALLEKELEYSVRAPFWQMARYIHFMGRRRI